MRGNLIINKEQKLTCTLCGRDKFVRRTPHKCIGGYRKRRIVWGIKTINGIWTLKKKIK